MDPEDAPEGETVTTEVTDAQAAPAEAPATPPEAEPEPQDKGKERLTARFSELTARNRASEERAARAEQEAADLRAQMQARHAQPAEDVLFDPYDPNQVGQAISKAVQQQLQTEREQAARQEAERAQASKASTLVAKLFESGLEGAVLIASGANIPFTQAMIDTLAVSEQAAQVADHLGRNPQEAARIAALPASSQGYELAKLEGRLASQPRTTAAPPPPPTVGSRATPQQGQRDDMPIGDWMRLERERRTAR